MTSRLAAVARVLSQPVLLEAPRQASRRRHPGLAGPRGRDAGPRGRDPVHDGDLQPGRQGDCVAVEQNDEFLVGPRSETVVSLTDRMSGRYGVVLTYLLIVEGSLGREEEGSCM